ncbi:trypsin-like peptidase domain-containing protein [Streptomyces sp. NPDC001817]|uniref:trypsin-like peptidase domain-containing protein n=1 Tax=Streptomyces sp. NPDC001817 TaxID=3154398 RepID=UPI00332A7D31
MAAVHADEHDDKPLGSGFLIDSRRVLTCAHVVCPRWDKDAPLWVAFPKSDQLMDRRFEVREVIAPHPPAKRHVQDVAVLVLADRLPDNVPARLRCPAPGALVSEAWWSFGFPDGDVFGNSADGSVGESLGYGWIRLDTQSRYAVKAGYSGAALWSPTYQAVVGMIGQASGATGDARALTLHHADRYLPDEKLRLLAEWTAEAAGESALGAWGWTLTDDPEAGRHWRPRARGVSTDAERGFRFRGRSAALTEIVTWMSSSAAPRHVLVVTGSPGVGKSAVLGRIVTSADPGIAASLPAGDDAVRAPLGSVSCAVHAKGKTALEVAEEIARAASASIPEKVDDLAPVLRVALTERPGTVRTPFTVVIDALDEATTPQQARLIATRIAMPLAETCADLQVRVLIGSRRRDDAGDLLTPFGAAARIIDLDTAGYFAEADLVAYALATLQLIGDERPDNPYSHEDVARPVARRIAELSDGNFLVAGLTSRSHGLHDTRAAAPSDIAFTPTVADALNEYLSRVPGVDGIPASTLFTALAYAEAPGLPLRLWATAVAALGGTAPTENRLQAFAHSAAANFLVETSLNDQNTGVFRLFHQALNDALLQTRARSGSLAADERALTRAFLALGRADGWDRAPAYLMRSLPRHASGGGAIDDLLADATYALYADLRRLIPAVGLAQDADMRDRAQLLRRTPLAIDASPAQRAALFSVTEAQEELGRTYRGLAMASDYRAEWASVGPRAEEAIMEGHADEVRAVCGVSLGGRTYLASAGNDGTIRLWDPVSTRATRVLRTGFGRIRALCGFVAEGRTLLAASADETVRLWDLSAGRSGGILAGHADGVFAMCTVDVGDRTLLASASADETVLLWDPVTGRALHVLEGHSDWVNGVCSVRVGDGTVLLASSSVDATVRLWDPVTGELMTTFRGHREGVNSVCSVRVGDSVLLASSGADQTIRLWDPMTGDNVRTIHGSVATSYELCAVDAESRPLLASRSDDVIWLLDPATGEPVAPLASGYADEIHAMCAFTTHGRTLLAGGGDDRTVRLWDPARTRTGRATAIYALCPVRVDDHTVLASGGDDCSVRLWDPATGEVTHTLAGHADWVRALCSLSIDGRTLVASGSDEGMVRLWDARTGDLVRTFTGHFKAVYAVCSVRIGDRTLLATASADHTVRLWDPELGSTVWTLQHDHGVYTVCPVDLGGRTLLATAADGGGVRLWDPVTGEAERTFTEVVEDVYAMCVWQTNRRTVLVTAGGCGTVRLWDGATGKVVGTLEGHASAVNALSVFDPGGRGLLVTASSDRTVRLWDPDALATVMEIPVQHPGLAVACAGRRLVVGLDHGLQALRVNKAL